MVEWVVGWVAGRLGLAQWFSGADGRVVGVIGELVQGGWLVIGWLGVRCRVGWLGDYPWPGDWLSGWVVG